MPSQDQLAALSSTLSASARLLSESTSQEFQTHLRRWSEINLQTPSAIVLPTSEDDCLKTVQWALSTETPFVVKSGGMSLYSTIGSEGIVIDLSDFASISHDKQRHEATLIGGVLTKAVAVELANEGHFTTLPSSNPVAAIPFFLNGGNSPLVAKVGYGSDNIISAHLITASGSLITVSETENTDLLYALSGAGQYFGLVTSLTVRTYPVQEVFGNDNGTFWSGRFVFPLERADEVGRALHTIADDPIHCTGGFVFVAALPPTHKPALIVTAKVIGPNCEAAQEDVFQPLRNLEPLASGGGLIRMENNADALDPLGQSGGYKKLRLTGIPAYNPFLLPAVTDTWLKLTKSLPEAARSIFGILWESQATPTPAMESANGMHGQRFWGSNLLWCQDQQSLKKAQEFLEQAIELTRGGVEEEKWVDFANSVREPESPLQRRYKGAERLDRLRKLKAAWDPEGWFGKELL